MSMVRSTDPDFRVCRISFESLLEIQMEAEASGFAARWTSAGAIRAQVQAEEVLLMPLMREARDDSVRAYRCALLFSSLGGDVGGGVATIDISPTRLGSMERIDRDVDVRDALAKVFVLALDGIAAVSKA